MSVINLIKPIKQRTKRYQRFGVRPKKLKQAIKKYYEIEKNSLNFPSKALLIFTIQIESDYIRHMLI